MLQLCGFGNIDICCYGKSLAMWDALQHHFQKRGNSAVLRIKSGLLIACKKKRPMSDEELSSFKGAKKMNVGKDS